LIYTQILLFLPTVNIRFHKRNLGCRLTPTALDGEGLERLKAVLKPSGFGLAFPSHYWPPIFADCLKDKSFSVIAQSKAKHDPDSVLLNHLYKRV